MRTAHILARLAERVPDPNEQTLIVKACMDAAAHYNAGTHAIRMLKLTSTRGTLTYESDGTGQSNGNCGVLIVKDGSLVTFMWRREHQPHTPEAYRVEKVHYNRGTR